MDEQDYKEELLSLTADIVSSHVSNNSVAVGDVPALIANVYTALAKIAGQAHTGSTGGFGPMLEKSAPAVAINKSVLPDHIVCLEDGKKLKMLKRHLKTAYGLSPDQYRERWNLPADYPMVAPNYARQRSKLAKQSGLGTGKKTK